MRRLLAGILSIILTTAPSLMAQSDEAEINRWLSWSDGSSFSLSQGSLYKIRELGQGSIQYQPCFGTYSTVNCDNLEEGKYAYSTVLGDCTPLASAACIQKVELQLPSDQTVLGKNVGEWTTFPSSGIRPDSIFNQIPVSRTSNLYSFTLPDGQELTLDVSPNLRYSIEAGVFEEKYLELLVQPIRRASEFAKPNILDSESPCLLWYQTSACYVATDLPGDFRIKLELKTRATPQGWVNGRILQPEITFKEENQMTAISIAGRLMQVPEVEKSYLSTNPKHVETWSKMTSFLGSPWDQKCGDTQQRCSSGPSLYATSIDSYVKAQAIDTELDKATRLHQKLAAAFTWEPKNFVAGSKICKTDGFSGFVGSNALTYEGDVPKYNRKTQTIDYRVASPHYMPDGKEFDGIYELQISRQLADCIWGVGFTKVKATISVLTDNGKQKVFTAVTRETKDFVRLSVYGFDYSVANFKVRLSKASQTKRTTIACVTISKPTTTKRITAVNPKCPKGYTKR